MLVLNFSIGSYVKISGWVRDLEFYVLLEIFIMKLNVDW